MKTLRDQLKRCQQRIIDLESQIKIGQQIHSSHHELKRLKNNLWRHKVCEIKLLKQIGE